MKKTEVVFMEGLNQLTSLGAAPPANHQGSSHPWFNSTAVYLSHYGELLLYLILYPVYSHFILSTFIPVYYSHHSFIIYHHYIPIIRPISFP